MSEDTQIPDTQKLIVVQKLQPEAIYTTEQKQTQMPASPGTEEVVAQMPLPEPTIRSAPANRRSDKKKLSKAVLRDREKAKTLYEECRQLGISLFSQGNISTRCLGFTSSIRGEGKTFLATVMATAIAEDSPNPVTLIDCNWDQPSLHTIVGCEASPGLAEWLRGECNEVAIRYSVQPNLTIIPAGYGKHDAVKLLQHIRQKGLHDLFGGQHANDLIILDLPAVLTTPYGVLAATLADALIIVVHTNATSTTMVEKTSAQLKDLPVRGVILNKVESRIPRWIQRLL